jgi:hypothetical protein
VKHHLAFLERQFVDNKLYFVSSFSSYAIDSGEGWKKFEVGQTKKNDANTKIVVRHECHI